MNHKEYAEYLKTDHWQEVRKMALENAGNKCVICSTSSNDILLNVHHNTYENIGEERETDVTVLCIHCHKLYHDNYKRCKVRKYFHRILCDFLKLLDQIESAPFDELFTEEVKSRAMSQTIDQLMWSDLDIDKMEVTVLDLEVD